MKLYTISVYEFKGSQHRFHVTMKDCQTGRAGRGESDNPCEAFREAERAMGEPIGFIVSADPADWGDEENVS